MELAQNPKQSDCATQQAGELRWIWDISTKHLRGREAQSPQITITALEKAKPLGFIAFGEN